MLSKMLGAVLVITGLSGCVAKITPTADDYVAALLSEDLVTLAAYERDGLRELALEHQASLPKHIRLTAYPLHAAVDLEKLKVVKFLLEHGHDVNQIEGRNTPLKSAVYKENKALVTLLLEHGALVNSTKHNIERRVVVRMFRYQTTEILRRLIEYGLDVNAADYRGSTPLFYAMGMGRLDVMKALIDGGANVNHVPDSGWGLLQEAVGCGHSDKFKNGEMVKLLIDAGADVNKKLDTGTTALALAVTNNHPIEVGLLLAANANPNNKDVNGWLPLLSAVHYNRFGMVKALIDAGADVNAASSTGWAPLHWSVNGSDDDRSDITALLIDAGADVNQLSKKQVSPLNLAVAHRHNAAFSLFVKHGANVNNQAADGWTPLITAVSKNNVAMARALINAGAKLDLAEDDGWSPLHFVFNGRKSQPSDTSEMLAYLTGVGADINRKNNLGETPLILAVDNNRFDEIELMLSHKPDIEIADSKGWTPLHHAAAGGSEHGMDGAKYLSLLIGVGANLDARVINGQTALMLASSIGRIDHVKLLIAQGADIRASNAQDNSMTALDYARLGGHLDVVELLTTSIP